MWGKVVYSHFTGQKTEAQQRWSDLSKVTQLRRVELRLLSQAAMGCFFCPWASMAALVSQLSMDSFSLRAEQPSLLWVGERQQNKPRRIGAEGFQWNHVAKLSFSASCPSQELQETCSQAGSFAWAKSHLSGILIYPAAACVSWGVRWSHPAKIPHGMLREAPGG